MMKTELNIGSGLKYNSNCINIDLYNKADVKHDLNKYPYPFKKNSFKKIYAFMIMEHLDDPVKFLKEIHRISKNNAKLIITVPHANCYYTWCNITHKRGFTKETFTQFVNYKSINNYYLKNHKFEITKLKQKPTVVGKIIPPGIRNILSRFINHLTNLIYVELKIIK